MILHEFKIRPTQRARLYYTVKIFDTKASLNKYADKNKLVFSRADGVAGLCTIYNKDSQECGEVLLINGKLGPRVVTHEVSHAMFPMKRRKGVGDLRFSAKGEPIAEDEEWCVDAIGQMTAKVYSEIHKMGLTQ